MMLLIFQLVSCSFMTGLIWTIQILHYPAFSLIPTDEFKKFHAAHSRNITFIVLPAMLLELMTAVLLILKFPEIRIFWMNMILVLLIWLSTFFLSVPCHNSLTASQDQEVIKRLVLTNWVRTILWSSRLCLLTFFTIRFGELVF